MKFSTITMALVLILLILVSYLYETEGRRQNFKLTEEEDLEPQMQLNSLNKPPIKSLKSKNGDIIDCIDIYKQPAFDHPLLKNHKLQMSPSSFPKEIRLREEEDDDDSRLITQIDQREFEGCPYGTVPFKRTSKEDLIRAKSTLALNRLRPSNPLPFNTHYAQISTSVNDLSQKYYGATTTISVYNLSLQLVDNQISAARLWLGSDVTFPYNSIEYGWTVNHKLYGDSQSRTYSFWTADGLNRTGCYNALCPGYVHISRKRMMGEVIQPLTIPGKDVYDMDFMIFKDKKSGNWWIYETLADKKNEAIGYWPKELFTDMKDSAAKIVQIGGKVFTGPTEYPTPPMGSGAFIYDDFTRTCYASDIQFVDSNNQFYYPKGINMILFTDIPTTYNAQYLGDASKPHPKKGYSLLFGGPIST